MSVGLLSQKFLVRGKEHDAFSFDDNGFGRDGRFLSHLLKAGMAETNRFCNYCRGEDASDGSIDQPSRFVFQGTIFGIK